MKKSQNLKLNLANVESEIYNKIDSEFLKLQKKLQELVNQALISPEENVSKLQLQVQELQITVEQLSSALHSQPVSETEYNVSG